MLQTAHRRPTELPPAAGLNLISWRTKPAALSPALWRISLRGWVSFYWLFVLRNKSTNWHTFIHRRRRLPCQLPTAHLHIWYVLERHKACRAWELDLLTKGLLIAVPVYMSIYLLVPYRPLSLCIPALCLRFFHPRQKIAPARVPFSATHCVCVTAVRGDLDWPISASETAE